MLSPFSLCSGRGLCSFQNVVPFILTVPMQPPHLRPLQPLVRAVVIVFPTLVSASDPPSPESALLWPSALHFRGVGLSGPRGQNLGLDIRKPWVQIPAPPGHTHRLSKPRFLVCEMERRQWPRPRAVTSVKGREADTVLVAEPGAQLWLTQGQKQQHSTPKAPSAASRAPKAQPLPPFCCWSCPARPGLQENTPKSISCSYVGSETNTR